MSYFNTLSESGQLLLEYREQGKRQDDLVLWCYNHLRKPLTPSQVWAFLKGSKEIPEDTPLTSIRRSITVLTGAMKLQKTQEKGKGRYGRGEYYWRLLNN